MNSILSLESRRGAAGQGKARAKENARGGLARKNLPSAGGGRAPDVSQPSGWVALQQYGNDEIVEFVIVSTGAGDSRGQLG
jgi:hypothetical protein